jgi:hypothetical protein
MEKAHCGDLPPALRTRLQRCPLTIWRTPCRRRKPCGLVRIPSSLAPIFLAIWTVTLDHAETADFNRVAEPGSRSR